MVPIFEQITSKVSGSLYINLLIRTQLKNFTKIIPLRPLLASDVALYTSMLKPLHTFLFQGAALSSSSKVAEDAMLVIFSICLMNTLLLPTSNLLCALTKQRLPQGKNVATTNSGVKNYHCEYTDFKHHSLTLQKLIWIYAIDQLYEFEESTVLQLLIFSGI